MNIYEKVKAILGRGISKKDNKNNEIAEIKCPHCSSKEVDPVDTISSETTEEEGYDLSSFKCNKCNEYFYVESFMQPYMRDVRTTKWVKS